MRRIKCAHLGLGFQDGAKRVLFRRRTADLDNTRALCITNNPGNIYIYRRTDQIQLVLSALLLCANLFAWSSLHTGPGVAFRHARASLTFSSRPFPSWTFFAEPSNRSWPLLLLYEIEKTIFHFLIWHFFQML